MSKAEADDSQSYVVHATPAVLERVYFAIERCKQRPELSAQAINREVRKAFGTPLSTAIWTTINAARRDDALDRIVTRSFDFSKHGRAARLGKSKASRKIRDGEGSTLAGNSESEKIVPDADKHPKFLVSAWLSGRHSYLPCRNRREAEREVRKLVKSGVSLGDVAIYSVESLSFQLGLSS